MMQSALVLGRGRAMQWMLTVGLATTSACVSTVTGSGEGPAEEPVLSVDGTSPTTGAYGATITVRGTKLARSTVKGVAPDGASVGLGPVTSLADQLTFRFAFPAEGEMTLTGPAGEVVSLGAFMPTWTPGQPAKLQGERVLGAGALGAQTVALVAGPKGSAFVVFGAGAPRRVEIASSAPDATAASLRLAGATLEALLTDAGGGLSLVTFDGNAAQVASYDAPTGRVLGTGVDDKGFVVVTQTADENLARLRGAPPTLTQEGALVPVPKSIASKVGVLAVAGDGTVVHAYAGSGGSFLDDVASFSMQALRADADELSTPISIGALDDTFKSIAAEVHGGVVTIAYCATNSGFFQSTTESCASAKTVDGRVKLALEGTAAPGDGAESFAAGNLTYATCESGDSLVVRTRLAGAPPGTGEPAIYPCSASQVHAVVAGASGARVLLESDGKLWAAHHRGR